MSAPKILYLGYGATGLACLADLLSAGCEVAGVLCRASDRDVEGSATGPTSVFRFARERGLHCFAATDPNSAGFLSEVERLAPDLLLSIQYDRILKAPLLALPRYGAWNLHFGPLPRLRGCFPTKWAILGNEPAGVTFHAIDPGIDSGDVVAQTIVPLAPGETDFTLYHRLEEAAIALFREQLPWLRALAPPPRRLQNEAEATYHPKALPYGGVLDWSRDAAWIERFIRAFTFPPHPAARTGWNGRRVEIRAPVEIAGDLPGRSPGGIELRSGGSSGVIVVACGAGSLLVSQVLLDGEARPAASLAPGRFTLETP